MSSASQSVVLIVSTGRTGTKAIATHLGHCCSDLQAFHEPRPTRFHLRRTGNRYLCGQLPKPQLIDILSRHRDRMLAKSPGRYYVESNPALSGFLDAFGDVFSDFRVVHVVRDPRTYVVSSLNWGVFRGARRALARFMPYWLPKPDAITNSDSTAPDLHHDHKPWVRMSGPERLAWHWSMLNRHLNRGQSLYGDRYLRMKYEDLFSRDGSGFNQLLNWLGLPPNSNLSSEANRENVNASRNRGFPKFTDWPPADRAALVHHCADLMTEYGYDVPDVAPTTNPSRLSLAL